MQKWVVVVLLLAALGTALLWQSDQLGKAKAREAQYIATIEEQAKAERARQARAEKDAKARANARQQLQKITDESNDLRQQLNALGSCFVQQQTHIHGASGKDP